MTYKHNTMSIEDRVALETASRNADTASAVSEIAFVSMAENGTIDEVTATEHIDVFSPWTVGTVYVKGNLRTYEDKLYKCVQKHTSQTDWTPDKTPALWVLAGNPAEEWPDWSQPVGAHDAYDVGAKVTYNNKHWVNTTPANIYAPGVAGWDEVTE